MDVIKLAAGSGRAFAQEVKKESGEDPLLCYQCGNCTAGCPYTEFFDYPVNQIMRLIQAGMREKVLTSKAHLALRHLRDLHHQVPLRDRRGPHHGHACAPSPSGKRGIRKRT